MAKGQRIAFTGVRLVEPESGYDGPGTVVVADGVIADVIRRRHGQVANIGDVIRGITAQPRETGPKEAGR